MNRFLAVGWPTNGARIAKIVALLGFLLPWVVVSCNGDVMARSTGLMMAMGKVTAVDPFTNATTTQSEDPSVLVIVALAAVVVGLIASLVIFARQLRAIAIIAMSALAIVLSVTAVFQVKAEAEGEISEELGGADPEDEFEAMFAEAMPRIEVETRYGFWLTVLALAAAAGLAGFSLVRKPE